MRHSLNPKLQTLNHKPKTLNQVRAVADFVATMPHELSLRHGQVLRILSRHQSGWWEGRQQYPKTVQISLCLWMLTHATCLDGGKVDGRHFFISNGTDIALFMDAYLLHDMEKAH